MQYITSKDNPNIRLYRKLSESKKYRRETGMFVLEGVRLIDDAVREKAGIRAVYASESCAENVFSGWDIPGAVCYVVSDELGRKMSATDNTQGVFAVCSMPSLPSVSGIINGNGKYIVLCEVRDPGNLGTIIRTADAMGVDGVFLSGCCELYNPKVIRSTMGSIFRLNVLEIPFEELVPVFAENGVKTCAAVTDIDAVSVRECDFSGGAAVIIGNEGNGLPENIVGICDEKITIKMRGNIDSLNAAMAAGIIMWEFTGHGN